MKRKYLPISSISLMGSCETKFLKAVMGELEVTPMMEAGRQRHEQLAEELPEVTREEIFRIIGSGERGSFREVFVTDDDFMTRGRIDQLDILGKTVDGKNSGLILDDKYPRRAYESLPLQYRLQLAGYASAVHHSGDFSGICRIVGARLVCRGSSHEVLRTFSVGTEELAGWEANVPVAVKQAWKIFKGENEPEHTRYDVASGEWADCWCGSGNIFRPK